MDAISAESLARVHKGTKKKDFQKLARTKRRELKMLIDASSELQASVKKSFEPILTPEDLVNA